jgi:hypothetical protein
MNDRTIINLTDTRAEDDRKTLDWLLAAGHVDDNRDFEDLDWDQVR